MADDVRSRYGKVFGRGENTERVQFFSDAVFAIAMTLLVLEIRLPEVPEGGNIAAALLDLWPQYFAYLLSFAIIAINWFTHHRKFRVIDKYDSTLIWINLGLLLLIAFVPFPTSLLSEYGPETPVVIMYAATVAALSIFQWWLWAHAKRADLLDESVDEELYRYVRAGLVPVPLVFGLSIVIALFSPLWAMYFWFLLWPLSIIVDRVAATRRSPARRNPDSASAADH